MSYALQKHFEAHQKLDMVRWFFSLCVPVDIESYFQLSVFNFEMELPQQCLCLLNGRGGAGIFGGLGQKKETRAEKDL